MSSSPALPLRATHGNLPLPPPPTGHGGQASHGVLPAPPPASGHGNLPPPPPSTTVTGSITMVDEEMSNKDAKAEYYIKNEKGDFNYPEHLRDPVGRKKKIAKSFFFMLGTQIASREARRAIAALITFLVLAMFMRNVKRATQVIIDKQECQTSTYTKGVSASNEVMQNMTSTAGGIMNEQSACYGDLMQNFRDEVDRIVLSARDVQDDLETLNVGGFPVPLAAGIGGDVFDNVVIPLLLVKPSVSTPTVEFDVGVANLNMSTNTEEVAEQAANDHKSLSKILQAINITQLIVMIGSWLYLLWIAYDLVFKAVFVRWRSLKDWIIYIRYNFYKILNKMMMYLIMVMIWYFVLFTQYIVQVIASYAAKLTMKESDVTYNYDLTTQGCGSFGKSGTVQKEIGTNCQVPFEKEAIPWYFHVLIWVWYFYPIVNVVVQYITAFTMNRFPQYFETGSIAKARKQARREWKDKELYSDN